MEKLIGLLPAAGLATRMRPFMYPKELLPVHFKQTNDIIRPKLLIEYALESFAKAGAEEVFIIVPDWKPEIMRYLGNGENFDHNIAYIYNSKARGLADALMTGYPWMKDQLTLFAMPDTVFSPGNAFRDLISKLTADSADLVLGVFPTNEAKHLAPVEFDKAGRVIQIWEKPNDPKYNNAWGIAVWRPSFWAYFRSKFAGLDVGISITEVFNTAASEGLKVYCVYFSEGWFKDVGQINNLPAISI